MSGRGFSPKKVMRSALFAGDRRRLWRDSRADGSKALGRDEVQVQRVMQRGAAVSEGWRAPQCGVASWQRGENAAQDDQVRGILELGKRFDSRIGFECRLWEAGRPSEMDRCRCRTDNDRNLQQVRPAPRGVRFGSRRDGLRVSAGSERSSSISRG